MKRGWNRVFGGYYKRIGSDGVTVVAAISRRDDGKWDAWVYPGECRKNVFTSTGHRTLKLAQKAAHGTFLHAKNSH